MEVVAASSPMETLTCGNSISLWSSRRSASTLTFGFPSISRKFRNSLHLLPRKCHCSRRNGSFSCFAAASVPNSVSYGGWEDLRLFRDSEQAGESQQFRNFLVSIGVDDRKYVLMFLLGLVSALAISRVRVSSMIVFPASVIVFAVGISFGFVRGRSMSSVHAGQIKRSFRDDSFRVCTEKLRSLVEYFNVLDGGVSDLKNSIETAIDCKQVTMNDLDSFVKATESIRLSALSARKVLEDSIDGMDLSGNVVESNGIPDENQKPNRRRKEGDRSESPQTSVNNNRGNTHEFSDKESASNLFSKSKITDMLEFSQKTSNKPAVGHNVEPKLGDTTDRIKMFTENERMGSTEAFESARRHLDGEQYSYLNNRSLFVKDHQIHLKMGSYNEIETDESLLNSVDHSVSMKGMKREASFGLEEQILKNSNGSCTPLHRKEESEKYNHGRTNEQSADDSELGSSSSSVILDDVIFDRCLSEANNLLKSARECLRTDGVDERRAEILLHKSSNLLSKAVGMKPSSLLAVGQLGNTYLLHGELKLKISLKLRSQLLRRDPSFSEKMGHKGRDDELRSRDKIASTLVNVCEQCEELLVEAGRKYRMALSIDGNDMRALYNWGLALSFRAQLIADTGPEAAFDADKVFLAAIDKFDAMMSKSNIYAPAALFRWGVALQQRSRLRPQSSKEKVKLLQQAKRLYKDALQMDSDNLQVTEALSSCESELNFR